MPDDMGQRGMAGVCSILDTSGSGNHHVLDEVIKVRGYAQKKKNNNKDGHTQRRLKET